MGRRNQNYQTQLTSDGWVDIYDPLAMRQGYAGEADMYSEFHQAVPKWQEQRIIMKGRDPNRPSKMLKP
jgi:hypothetical protein